MVPGLRFLVPRDGARPSFSRSPRDGARPSFFTSRSTGESTYVFLAVTHPVGKMARSSWNTSSRVRLDTERCWYIGAPSTLLARPLTRSMISRFVGDSWYLKEGAIAHTSVARTSNHRHSESSKQIPAPAFNSRRSSFSMDADESARNARSPATTITGKRGLRSTYRIFIIGQTLDPNATKYSGHEVDE
jgi:hypothetical protein